MYKAQFNQHQVELQPNSLTEQGWNMDPIGPFTYIWVS